MSQARIEQLIIKSMKYSIEFDGQEEYAHAISGEWSYQQGLIDALLVLTDEYGNAVETRKHFRSYVERRRSRPKRKTPIKPKRVAKKPVPKKIAKKTIRRK